MTKQKFLWLVKKYYKGLVRQAEISFPDTNGGDIVNEFVVYVLSRKAHLKVKGSNRSLKSWLYVCIRNQTRRAFRIQHESYAPETTEVFYTPEGMELKADVDRAMLLLSRQDQMIARHVLMGNDTYESIAGSLGMRPSEVLLRIDEIKAFLSKRLESYKVGKLQAKSG